MQDNFSLWAILGGVFVAVVAMAALAGEAVLNRRRMRAKFASIALTGPDRPALDGGLLREWVTKLTGVDDRLLGFDDEGLRSRARLALIRAGFFNPDAAKYFALVRACLTIAAPLFTYLVVMPFLPSWDASRQMLLLIGMVGAGYFGPDFYARLREDRLLGEYRNAFPDMLDLIVVCMDAGSSINASLDRVGRDIGFQSRALAINLQLLVSEMRSGRSLADALGSFSKRVGLEEARALSILIKQSVELGTDLGDALRTFSDEMRDKRLMRAEAKAYALPAKIVVPLGLFIFPAVMLVLIAPAAINLAATFAHS
jgi:tight adherence protein C